MRLVSLSPATTEILYALGCDSELVAVTNLCDYPPGAKTKARIGTWIRTDEEKLVSYHPDLIFTSFYLPPELNNWVGPGEIIHVDPKTLDGVYESIRTIAKSVGKESLGISIIGKMKKKFKNIEKKMKSIPKPRIYMEEWHSPPFVSGNWVPDILEISGGKEDLIKPGELSRELTLGELLRFDPDIIVCHWCGAGNIYQPGRIRERKEWRELKAVKNGKIFFVDDALLNRPGPRLTQGAEKLAQIIHEFQLGRAIRA